MNYRRLLYIILALSFLAIFVMMTYSFVISHGGESIVENRSMDNLSYDNWTYDKKEYPRENYTLEQICPPHTNPDSIKKFFDESDFNHDGLLSGGEIGAMDYKLKHSQYTYNGPYGYNWLACLI